MIPYLFSPNVKFHPSNTNRNNSTVTSVLNLLLSNNRCVDNSLFTRSIFFVSPVTEPYLSTYLISVLSFLRDQDFISLTLIAIPYPVSHPPGQSEPFLSQNHFTFVNLPRPDFLLR